MKLSFKSTAVLPIYSSAELGDLKDGEIVDVPQYLGLRLLADFPDNFSKVEESLAQTIAQVLAEPKTAEKAKMRRR